MSADEIRSPLPPPDPAVGNEANQQASQARRSALQELTDGSITLEELFTAVDQEEPHHQLGHMHLRAALLALPHVGEKRADAILEAVEVEGDRHIDTIGTRQQAAIISLVESYQPVE